MTTTTHRKHLSRAATVTLSGLLLFGGSGALSAPANAVQTVNVQETSLSGLKKPIASGPFKDVSYRHPLVHEITWATKQGVMSGYRDGTFRPDRSMTRGDLAETMYRYAGNPRYNAPKKSPYRDVRTNHPQYKQIMWAKAKGILDGRHGRFNPGADTSRGETAAAMYRFAGSPSYSPPKRSEFRDVSKRDRYYKEIHWVESQGIIKGNGKNSFRPGNDTTRGAMANLLSDWWVIATG